MDNKTVPTLDMKNVQSKNVPITSSRLTFRTKANKYVINNNGSDEDVQDIHNMINDIYYETMSTASSASWKAYFCKSFHIFGTIFIIICSSVTGALSAISNNLMSNYNMTSDIKQETNIFIVITVLSFSITVVKTLLSIFNVEQRGVILKEISVGLQKIARDIKNLKSLNLSADETIKRIDAYHTQIDDLSINMFGTSINKSSLKTDDVDENVVNI
jgi:hypothetical protein